MVPSTQLRSGDGTGCLDRLAQGQTAGLLGQHQVQRRGEQPPFPVGPDSGEMSDAH